MMLRRGFAALASVLLGLGVSAGVSAQERHLSYEFDLRPPLEGDAALGLDFNVRLETTANPGATTGHAIDASGFAKGFRTLGEPAGDVDHIALGVELGGRYLTGGNTELTARERAYFLFLLDQDAAGGGPGLTSEQEAALNRFTTLRRKYYGYKLIYHHESTQEFDDGQHALGVQLVGELPVLHTLLDVLPGATRAEGAFRPQPVRLGVGLDLVTGVDSTFAGAMDHEAEMGRLRLEAAWSTTVFAGLPLTVLWQGHYLFAGPDALSAAGRSFNGFLDASIMVPLAEGGRSGVKLKYLTGRLPPNYELSDGAEFGFTFAVF